MDKQLTDEQILEISKRIGPTGFATPTHTYYGFTQPRLLEFARALLSQQVAAARNAALEEAAKRCESLVAELGVHSNFACAMIIRALSSPAEAERTTDSSEGDQPCA